MSVVVIIELELYGELTYAGVLADAVQDVIEYAPSDLEPAPQFGSRLCTSMLAGMGRHENGVFLVLDLKVLFGGSTPRPSPHEVQATGTQTASAREWQAELARVMGPGCSRRG